MIKKMSMHYRMLLTILPITIIPLLIVAVITIELVKDRMISQSRVFYTNIISQVESNIDYFYNQYAIVLLDITQTDSFIDIVSLPQADDFASQRLNEQRESGLTKYGKVRTNVTAKTKGDFLLLELDRFDHGRNTDFTLTKFSVNDIVLDSKERIMNSDVYKELIREKNMKPVFSSSKHSGLNGFELEFRPGFFSLYLADDKSEPNKIVCVVETKDFLYNIYGGLTSLFSGTLYILDPFLNILTQNHPTFEDYYDYDKNKKQYIKNLKDPDIDPFTGLSFKNYSLLNTDPAILDGINIKSRIDALSEQESKVKSEIIKHNGVEYLAFYSTSELSGANISFFQPLKQIYGAVVTLINSILIFVVVVVFLVFVLSYFTSRFFTAPIADLTEAARKIKIGDYTTKVDGKKYFGEFSELGDSFNEMTVQINDYSHNLEDLVKKRTDELEAANINLKSANETLVVINENNHKELLLAQKIQSALIPKEFPNSKSLDISGMYLPMEALGGDLYDVFSLSNNKFGILILDVCGHGVPAALITTMAKMSFATNSKLYTSPREVMYAVNNNICDTIQGSGDFLTSFYGVIDIDKMTLTYSNAGHNDMIVFDSNQQVKLMGTNGPIVGVFPSMEFGEEVVQLKGLERIVLYTDGVIEAMNKEKSLYETERLMKQLYDASSKTPIEFTSSLYNDIITFKGEMSHNDDIAVMVIDVK